MLGAGDGRASFAGFESALREEVFKGDRSTGVAVEKVGIGDLGFCGGLGGGERLGEGVSRLLEAFDFGLELLVLALELAGNLLKVRDLGLLAFDPIWELATNIHQPLDLLDWGRGFARDGAGFVH